MSKKDTAEIINNLDGLTIGHIFQLVRKIKFSALLSIFAIFSSLVGGAYALGKNSQQKDTAVMLQSPFSMSYKNQSTDFTASRLMLIRDPMAIAPEKDAMVLSLRQVQTEFDIVEVGKIIAKVEKEELSWPWSWFAQVDTNAPMTEVNMIYTSADFDWKGHKGDFNFTEKFIEEDVVNRFYSDDCILEYKVDKERRSIPSTFKWINNTH